VRKWEIGGKMGWEMENWENMMAASQSHLNLLVHFWGGGGIKQKALVGLNRNTVFYFHCIPFNI
jgi:hypothetical protein